MGEVLEMKKGEAKFDVKIEEGKVKLAVSYDGIGADASFIVALEAEYFVGKITAAIPGEYDDALAGLLLAALKKV